MKSVYLDNAAGTPMLPEVIEVMQKAMTVAYGNPSSTHAYGRKAKTAIETARKNIAKYFNVSAAEIIFTSSGTEGDNFILQNAVINLDVQRIITSKIEHHAVLKVLDYLKEKYNIIVDYVEVDEFGSIDLVHLESLLATEKGKVLVSLMLVNNEIGNILPLDKVCRLCKSYNALFHSDTVQAIGSCHINLKKTPIDFIVSSAHKFHGPKGIGFVYVKKGHLLKPLLYGGGQENGKRSSTENVPAILGMEKALEIAYKNIDADTKHKKELKEYCIIALRKLHENILFNGYSANLDKSNDKILNVRLPIVGKMMLFNLDLLGVAVSGGSACQSGANKGSHVLQAFLNNEEQQKSSLRFSFSKLTTKENIDFAIIQLERFFSSK